MKPVRPVHVIPVGKPEPLHVACEQCWCSPLRDGDMYVHHAKDGREKWERQGIKHEDKKWVLVHSEVESSGILLIAAERQRQMTVEGWTPEHDDKHTDFEMGKAADSYLCAVISPDEEGDENGKPRPAWDWPWDKDWWKPSEDPVRNLVKAGALIAAEIDRLQRLKEKS